MDESTGAQTEALKGCEVYNTYTAALGDATVACLGTISPNAYAVDRLTGQLVRKFEKCTVPGQDPNNPKRDALQDIDDLLSLQSYEKDLPRVTSCVAGAWTAWQRSFLAAGNTTCPTYKKIESFGVAAVKPQDDEHYVNIEKYVAQLPPLGAKPTEVKTWPTLGKTYSYYAVEFPGGKNPNKSCRSELDCANACGAAFGGFVDQQNKHEKYFVGDPSWWVANEYPPGANPYLAPGYYHPMSFVVPSPGEIFGHRARVGEACSKFVTSTIHYTVRLVEQCLNPAMKLGCVARCAGPATDVYSTGVK